MNEVVVRPLSEVFAELPDHRQAKGRRHALATILTVVVLALISQQNSLRQIASWAAGLDRPMRRRLKLRHGKAPSFETIRRTLRDLDADALATQVQAWVEAMVATYELPQSPFGLAIDGKTCRGSRDEAADTPALQVLNVLVHGLGVVLVSRPVGRGSSELSTIQPLLAELVLSGRVVTLDANFTHQGVAHTLLEKGGTICCG
jgi:hypothetical protein